MARSWRSWSSPSLVSLDRSGDDARAKKDLNPGAQGVLGASVDAEEDRPAAFAAALVEVWDINDDNYMAVVGEGNDDAHFQEVGWGVGPGAGDGSNEEAGGGAGGALPAVSPDLAAAKELA